jgi:hypothetical protein
MRRGGAEGEGREREGREKERETWVSPIPWFAIMHDAGI